ncbi:MAG: hypothetical protein WDZ79_00880 [Candidatus Paceibacterota bacterium]
MTIRGQRTLHVIVGATVMCLLVGYGLFQARHMLTGPIISIQNPPNGATVQTSLVDVKGTTSNISALTLNNRTIFINEEGFFDEPVVLAQGYNVITVSATDRFGRTTQDTVEIVHTPLTQSDPDRLSQERDRSSDTVNES